MSLPLPVNDTRIRQAHTMNCSTSGKKDFPGRCGISLYSLSETGRSVKVSPSGNKSRLTREFGDLQVGGQLIERCKQSLRHRNAVLLTISTCSVRTFAGKADALDIGQAL